MYVCMCIYIYTFFCLWTLILRLLPYLGYCKYCCYEHWDECIFSNKCFCFSGIHPGVELLSHMVVLFFVFWGTCILSSSVVAPIYILSAGSFPFSHILTSFVICILFDDSHSDRCEIISHCDFDLYVPDD